MDCGEPVPSSIPKPTTQYKPSPNITTRRPRSPASTPTTRADGIRPRLTDKTRGIHPALTFGLPYLLARELSGRALDSRPKGLGFEPHRRHCVVSLSKNINPSLVLVLPRKTRPFITERLLMGRKESNQTKKLFTGKISHLLFLLCLLF